MGESPVLPGEPSIARPNFLLCLLRGARTHGTSSVGFRGALSIPLSFRIRGGAWSCATELCPGVLGTCVCRVGQDSLEAAMIWQLGWRSRSCSKAKYCCLLAKAIR